MIKKIRRIISNLLVSALMLAPIIMPVTVSAAADIDQSLCKGASLDVTDSAPSCDTSDAGDSINNIIATVINIFSIVVGVIAVIMIIIGGIRYITSGGDSGNVSAAKNTIIYAIIGLVVVALAQIIVQFVLTRVSSQI